MRGGKRNGAGRPKGAATKKTRTVADRAASKVTPLEVILEAMNTARKDGDLKAAAAYARDAAPYCHPRLQTTTLKGDDKAPVVVKVLGNVRMDEL